jgi:hypothetical protein
LKVLSGGLGGLCANWASVLAAGEKAGEAADQPARTLLGKPAVAPARTAKAKSVILIFNCGAPSHIDLWDPKPDATDTVRGEFATISTAVPGIHVTELLPNLAKRTDKLAIVRTLHHKHGQHNSGMHWSIVGRPYRVDNTLINPSPTDEPSFGTLVGWLAQRDGYSAGVPPYVITPEPHCDSKVYITPGQFGGCLGVRYDPFVVGSDPNAADFKVRDLRLHGELSGERLADRARLVDQLNAASHAKPRVGEEIDVSRANATAMLASGDAAAAFDLSKESDATRDRYGRHSWGQSHLLARRLVEAGTRFVTTVNGPSIVWDTHENNTRRLKERLVPPMERAFVALLDDLDQRGLLDTTLVVWLGDFGRTPVINKQAGRDHWPQCYSAVLAGGGIRGGQVIGQSDRTGAIPHEQPLAPADLHATVFAALGYDAQRLTYKNADGRPMQVTTGEPIRELL